MAAKTIEELENDLVFKEENMTPGEPNQHEHARTMLQARPALVEVLRTPLKIVPLNQDDVLGTLALQGTKGVKGMPGNAVEFPLGQNQPLNSWFEQGAEARKVGLRAAKTAQMIKAHPRAVVISMYNAKEKKNELVVERSLFRAVCKLIWFRIKSFADKYLTQQ